VNSLGTTYGNDLTFVTGGQAPTATTVTASNVQGVSATLNGTVNANLLSTVVTYEYGLSASYGLTATATQSPVTGSTPTSVSANVLSLAPASTYHYRVKAVNVLGTTYGNDFTFTTLGEAPVARTEQATDITSTGAKLNATAYPFDLSTTVTFEYGLSGTYGTVLTATQSPVTGSDGVSVSVVLTGLSPATTYYYIVKAVNALGESIGDELEFTTSAK
jgi:phosphodiesterase/alkaline phosphatase D-like protein